MGFADDLTAQPTVDEPRYTAKTEFDGRTGTIQTGPMPETPKNYTELLKQFGYDPDEVEIVGTPREKRWQRWDGEWLASYGFSIAARGVAKDLDLDDLFVKASEWPAAALPTVVGSRVLVWQLSDTQFGKALADATPMLTTEGWTTHGDLQPGDMVYGPDGAPKKVLAVTGSSEQDMYEIEFDRGVRITASGDHEWVGERRLRFTSGGTYVDRMTPVRMTTDEIRAMPKVRNKNGVESLRRTMQVPLPKPLEMPPGGPLPIDPYVYGLWLGDGDKNRGYICKGEADAHLLDPLGHRVPSMCGDGKVCVNVPGLTSALSRHGLLGEKKVPREYITASVQDRIALLRGLFDTDGTVSKAGGQSFCNTNRNIADAVAEILSSLGFKFNVSEKIPKLNGREMRTAWIVNVSANDTIALFSPGRKADRIRTSTERERYRQVVRVHNAGRGSAQCITVEGGLYLAGTDLIVTHNCDGDGLEGTLGRLHASLDRVIDRAITERPKHLLIAAVGDCIEGVVSQGGRNMWRTNLTITEQTRVWRRFLFHALTRLAPLVPNITVAVVNGNHDQAQREPVSTRADDGWATEGAIAVSDAIEGQPAFSHVNIIVPERDKGYMTFKCEDSTFVALHGHQLKRGKAAEWWQSQAFYQDNAAGADFMIHGHWHSTYMSQDGPRTILCSGTYDGGSNWYRDLTGAVARQGGLMYSTVGADFYGLELV